MGNEFDLHESVNISPFMTYKQKPSIEIDLVLLFATSCIGNSNLESTPCLCDQIIGKNISKKT